MSKLRTFQLGGFLVAILACLALFLWSTTSKQEPLLLKGAVREGSPARMMHPADGYLEREYIPSVIVPGDAVANVPPSAEEELRYGFLEGILSGGSPEEVGNVKLEVFDMDAVGMGMSARAVAKFSTTAGGLFKAKLPVGHYLLVSTRIKVPIFDPKSGQRMRTQGASIPLEEFQIFEDAVTSLSVELNQGHLLRGQVVNADDPASTTFMLRVIRETDGKAVAWSMALADPSATGSDQGVEDGTDYGYQHGYFFYPRFQPGAYRLEVSLVTGPGNVVRKPWTKSFLMPAEDFDLGLFQVSAFKLRGGVGSAPPVAPRRIRSLGGGLRGRRVISGKTREGETIDEFLRRSMDSLSEEKEKD